jgi:hypothetical protein
VALNGTCATPTHFTTYTLSGRGLTASISDLVLASASIVATMYDDRRKGYARNSQSVRNHVVVFAKEILNFPKKRMVRCATSA